MERNKVSIDCIGGKITLVEVGDPQSPGDIDVVSIAGVFDDVVIFFCCGYQVAISRRAEGYEKVVAMAGKTAILMKEE